MFYDNEFLNSRWKRAAATATVLFGVSGCVTSEKSSGPSAPSGSLNITQVNSGERASGIHCNTSAGIAKFRHIMRDWRDGTKMENPRSLCQALQSVVSNFPGAQVNILSGTRSKVTNTMLRSRGRGAAKDSNHTRGLAADFFLTLRGKRISLTETLKAACRAGSGVGYYPSSGSPFIHMDVGSRRDWPGAPCGDR